MPIEVWLAFCAASFVLLAIPGPTIMLVVTYALGQGRRAAVPTVAGVALGDFVAMTASLAGLGVLLATSAFLFTVLKWIGAAYLVYLGVRLWLADAKADVQSEGATAARSDKAMFWHAFAVTALNPKSIVFFVAFLPQFITAGEPLLVQLAIMEASFLVLATLNAAAFAFVAGGARAAIGSPRVLKWVNRTGGSVLIGAGVAAVALDRPQ